MRSVRIFFEKKGLARFISHLDLMRCFSRAVKRAGIDIWYTEGYNPRPYMNFSLPLPLGTESLCESVDIRTNDEMPFDEIRSRLNSVMPDGIYITAVSQPLHKQEEIALADFTAVLYTDAPDSVANELSEKLESAEINIEKKAKQGKKKVIKQVNIKPNIIKYSLETGEDRVTIKMTLTNGIRNNTNPVTLLAAVTEGIADKISDMLITKEKMYIGNSEEFR